MRRLLSVLTGLAIATSPAWAGVSMTMETVDAAGVPAYRTTFRSDGARVRMDNISETEEPDLSTIFLGDRFIVVEHEERRYAVVDQAMLDEVGTQLDAAMKEMEKQLAGLPPEQRAMAEKMMQQQMAGLMGTKSMSARRVEESGSGEWNGQSCRKYSVFEGGNLTQEICTAALDQVEGAAEALQAFQRMAGYLHKMTEALPMAAAAGPNPGELLDQVSGFPVVTRDYRMGRVVQTMTLVSAEVLEIDEGAFAVPEGYSQREMKLD